MFQMANVGPMMGQAGVFSRYFEPKLDDAIARYQGSPSNLQVCSTNSWRLKNIWRESTLSLIWLLILGCVLRIGVGCLVTILKSDSLDGYS